MRAGCLQPEHLVVQILVPRVSVDALATFAPGNLDLLFEMFRARIGNVFVIVIEALQVQAGSIAKLVGKIGWSDERDGLSGMRKHVAEVVGDGCRSTAALSDAP